MNLLPGMMFTYKTIEERKGTISSSLIEFLSFAAHSFYPPLEEEFLFRFRLSLCSLIEWKVFRY